MSTHTSTSQLPRELPLVGRSELMESLHRLFGTADGAPLVTLTGESGVGKSRLAMNLGQEAERRDWTVAYGLANPIETGVPYALVADALLPILKELDEATLTVLSRGATLELRQLFPALGATQAPPGDAQEPEELKMRLYWNFTEFLKRLAERSNILLVLEDLHWADPSSLALLHFVARHVGEAPIRIVATVNTDYRDRSVPLVDFERSLISLGAIRPLPVHPVSQSDTTELLSLLFKVSGSPVQSFSDLLFGWTRGNPYFVEETLKSLIESGTLYQRDGTWLGWEAQELALPGSIRDAIETRLKGLSEPVRAVAETLAVAGGRANADLLDAVLGLDPNEFMDSLETLIEKGILDESGNAQSITVVFHHPLLRETIYSGLSLIRRRARHAAVARCLEELHGASAIEHADELAYHLVQAGSAKDPRTVRYLAAAGQSALSRHADREGLDYLEAAVESLKGLSTESAHGLDLAQLTRGLARARSRLGLYDEAMEIWSDVLLAAEAAGDAAAVAGAHRNLGVLLSWQGRAQEAIEQYDAGRAALGDQDSPMAAQIELNAGVAIQALGRPEEAKRRIETALAMAERHDNQALLARGHRALALLYTWTGHSEEARKHAWQAINIADRTSDGYVRFWGRWALAALDGLVGNTAEMNEMLVQARAVADELHFPALNLHVAELAIEYHWATGDWDVALAVGERALSLGRSLNQRSVLPRLLVWTALVYFGRGDFDRGDELVAEAVAMVGSDDDENLNEIHRVIPTYIGRMQGCMAREQYEEVVELGNRAIRIVDKSGYVVWLLHRILPLVGEAYIRLEQVDEADKIGKRLREEAEAMGHRLGMAWADACDALVTLHQGDLEGCIELFQQAAESLDEIPLMFEAARLRRQLAGRLADLGDRKASVAELRKVHDVFGRLGAQPELQKARGQFLEVGSRPPSRIDAEGVSTLTPRETQIARLVADHRSDKGIAKVLSISPRTVTTHLGNVYRKLGITSRAALGELIREGRLPQE